MPWSPPIPFRPGINTVMTTALNANGWSASNCIRFRDGIPEKNGGWARLSSETLIGTARGVRAWSDLDGLPYAMFGTEQRLQVLSVYGLQDVSPILLDNSGSPQFTTVATNTTVTISDSSAPTDLAVGDWLNVNVPVSIGGIVLQGMYQVTSVTLPDFTVVAASAAVSSAGPGGVVPEYTTTSASPTIKVTLPAHGYVTGDEYVNQVATTVGSIQITGFTSYLISNVIDVDNFQFTNGIAAGSDDMQSENGGDADLQYLYPTGFVSAVLQAGYGVGLYGLGLYGISSGNPSFSTIRQWFMDHWGQDWIGNFPASPIFVWVPPWALGNRAIAINTTNFPDATDPPQTVNVSFVCMPQQILMALGCEPSADAALDPNLIRWCDVSDFTQWVASATNQAGSFRIPTGSRLVGGVAGPTFGVIWTDEDMYIFNYLGFPLVFGFNRVTGGTGLIAGRACATAGGVVYWVAQDGLYKFDGSSVSIVPCPTWDTMWRNLNRQQIDKVFLWINSWFNEIAIVFPSLSSADMSGISEDDCYIRLNYRENVWDIGSVGTLLTRTCGCDNNVFGAPLGTTVPAVGATGGLIMQQENGTDADGQQMGEFITSGYFSIDNGWLFTVLNQIVSDFKYEGNAAQLVFYILTKNYPKDDAVVYGPFTDAPTQPEFEAINARGRMAAVSIGMSSVGTFWRLGWFRYLFQPDGSL